MIDIYIFIVLRSVPFYLRALVYDWPLRGRDLIAQVQFDYSVNHITLKSLINFGHCAVLIIVCANTFVSLQAFCKFWFHEGLLNVIDFDECCTSPFMHRVERMLLLQISTHFQNPVVMRTLQYYAMCASQCLEPAIARI